MLMIYKIQLPYETDAKAFATFMNEEYFPAVNKGSLRAGKVVGLVLFAGDTTDITNQFFWHIDVDGSFYDLRVDDAEVQSKFDSFGAKLEPFGSYVEVAAWYNKSGK